MSIGGKRTSETNIDPDLKAASLETLKLADQAGRLGFTPYTGPTVAGFTPSQAAAVANTNQAASAFGLAESAGPAMTGGEVIPGTGGAVGYSPYGIYEQALANMDPEKRAMIEAFLRPPEQTQAPVAVPEAGSNRNRARPQTRQSSVPGSQMAPLRGEAPSGGFFGFTGLADMFDGGGAGQSGDTFKGPYSMYSNLVTTPRTRG